MPASVDSIELNQKEIALNCSADDKSCTSNKIIKVKTSATVFEDTKYVYTVSAGKIIGKSAKVEWDLTNVKPGKYTIAVGISQYHQGFGWSVFGQTKTEVVTIKECSDCED